MSKTTPLDRILLLASGLLAAYQVAVGIEGLAALPLASFTVTFGGLLLAGLLLLLLGLEALDSPLVAIAATLIPLSLSLGLVSAFLPGYQAPYLVFTLAGFLLIAATRFFAPYRIAVIALAFVHGVAGLVICFLPIGLAATGRVPAGFALVGVGGALIGLGGLLLSFLKTGRPLLSRETVLSLFPGLLFLTTSAFVAGFILR